MLNFMGWQTAADIIWQALVTTVKSRTVTYDLARQIDGAREVNCSVFAQGIVNNMN